MFGAILGDIIGCPYEFGWGNKSKDFPLFRDISMFTDDSVMTIAVAEVLLDVTEDTDETEIKEKLTDSMKAWGRKYPDAGYGGRFSMWLQLDDRQPYYSYGNGSAMRVSSAGWLFDDIETTRKMARLTAKVTHNHPEGIKGAEATASAIFMARTGMSKEEIKDYIQRNFIYDMERTCDEIRPWYYHVESCMETVPEAIISFLEGTDFEDSVRNAVSLGGDADTLGAITGSIAEAFFGISDELKKECYNRITEEMANVLRKFEERIG